MLIRADVQSSVAHLPFFDLWQCSGAVAGAMIACPPIDAPFERIAARHRAVGTRGDKAKTEQDEEQKISRRSRINRKDNDPRKDKNHRHYDQELFHAALAGSGSSGLLLSAQHVDPPLKNGC